MLVKWWRRLTETRDDAADTPPPSARDLRDERLSASLDGALTPDELAALEADLALDAELQQELYQLREVTSLLATLEIERAPRSFALAAPPPLPLHGGSRGRLRQIELFMRIGAATAALAFVAVLAGDLGGGNTGTPVTSAPATGGKQDSEEELAITESFAGESPAAGDTSDTGGGSTERNAAGASGAAEAPAGTGQAPSTSGGGTEPDAVEPEIAPAIAPDGAAGSGPPVEGQEEGIAPEPAIAIAPVAPETPVAPENGANDVATDGTTDAATGGIGGGWSPYPPPMSGGPYAGGAGGKSPDSAMNRLGGGASGGSAFGAFDGGTTTRYTVTTRVNVDGLLVAELALGALTLALVLGLVLVRLARRVEP